MMRYKCNECGWLVRDSRIEEIKKTGEHVNANGQLVPNDGIAFCKFCDDATLVQDHSFDEAPQS